MGPHVIRTTNIARTWTQQSPIVKGCGNVGILQSAPANAIRVFRWVFNQQNLDDAVGTSNIILDMLAGYRHPNLYVEVFNEAHPTLAQLRAVTDLLHAQGLKVAGGSWGTGDYTLDDWNVARAAGVDAFAVHCYWDPGELTIYEAFRYRMFWQSGDKPVLITECGRRHGQTPVAELVAYAGQISTDGFVLGATPFTNGATQDWIDQGFDLDPITPDLMAALGGQPVPTPTPPPLTTYARGCDLSNNNGAIDTALLAKCVDFALFKASEGTDFTDDYFGPNWYGAGVASLPRAAYHFGRPFSNSGNAEALYFLNVLTQNGFNRGDVLALDLEEDPAGDPGNTADLLAYTLDFLRTIYGALGVRPLLYARTEYMARHNLTGNAELGQYGLWLADYQTDAYPDAPDPWPFVALWQYGSGQVPGVTGDVDLNVFAGSVDQFKKYGKA